ncbi:MAG: membrane protein insertion efficiency factor YidD [Patescibacteria group bacterium]|nr:membrane protein insertion efficiency factor YidD [Patescibacteria group bacterium]
MQSVYLKIKHLSSLFAINLIRLYQRTLSFDHGVLKIFAPYGRCRFHPTCSQYAIDAIDKYGLFKGLFKTCWRILRCNPWNKGGYDPVN